MTSTQKSPRFPKPPRPLRLGLLLWLALMALLSAGLWVLQQNAGSELEARVRVHQQGALHQALTVLQDRLSFAARDLQFVARSIDPDTLQAEGASSGATPIEHMFLDLMATRRSLYSQLRYLDAYGQEIARVNNVDGKTLWVPAEALQNKASRYYFRESIGLSDGEMYLSPFDLNVEHGKIERPFNPTMRFAARASDQGGELQGVVVINFLGHELIDRLRSIGADRGIALWMSNADGDWLIGPDRDAEWGFMFPEKHLPTFGKQYPQAWGAATQAPSTGTVQMREVGAMLAMARFTPAAHMLGGEAVHTKPSMRWHLVAQVSPERLAAMRAGLMGPYILAYGVLAVLFAGISILVARLSARRRQALIDLTQREQQFRSLLEAAPDAMLVSDGEGLIRMVNLRAESTFGLPRDKLIGQPVEILVPERMRNHHARRRDAYMRSPAAGDYGEGREVVALRADGSEFPASIALSTLDAPGGRLVISAVRDVSEARASAAVQRELSQRLSIAADAGGIGIWDYDVRTKRQIWDERMYRIFGIARSASASQAPAWERAVHPDDEAAARKALKATLRGNTDLDIRFRIRRGDGEVRWIKANAVAVSNSRHRVRRLIGTCVDVTSEVEKKQRLRAAFAQAEAGNADLKLINKDLEAFSYAVSEMLRRADAVSNILSKRYDEKLDERGRELLRQLSTTSRQTSQLIDEMLLLTRIGGDELVRAPINLSAMVKEGVARLRAGSPQREVEVVIQPDVMAQADRRLMRLVLESLLDNAWKFTRKAKKPTIEFGCQERDGQLEYFVRDNGVGFDMKQADKLFDALQRLHEDTELVGNGIGLATVKRAIRKHGGEVHAKGAVGLGASFFFTVSPSADEA